MSKTRQELEELFDEVTGPNADLKVKRDYYSRRNKEFDDEDSMDEESPSPSSS